MTEITFYVAKTPTGFKVECRNRRGLRDGLFTKSYQRYFYGESAKQDAVDYAERKVEKYDSAEVDTAHNIDP